MNLKLTATPIRDHARTVVLAALTAILAVSLLPPTRSAGAERIPNAELGQATEHPPARTAARPAEGHALDPQSAGSSAGDPAGTRAADVAPITETMAPPPFGTFAYSDLTVRATGTVGPEVCGFGYCIQSTLLRHADLHLSISNLGSGPSAPTQVLVWAIGNGLTESKEVDRLAVPALAPGATVRLASPRVDCGGNGHQILVDPDNRVPESNEQNNLIGYSC